MKKLRRHMRKLHEAKMTRQQADEFNYHINRGRVLFKFLKKDGTLRYAIGTLNPSLMPTVKEIREATEANGVNYDDMMQDMLNKRAYMPFFWDLVKGGYRRFHVSRFEGYVEINELSDASAAIPEVDSATLEKIINDIGTPDAYKPLALPGSKVKASGNAAIDVNAIVSEIKKLLNGQKITYKIAS